MTDKKEIDPSITSNVMKVITLGLQDEVIKAMAQPGFSAEALSRKFTAEGKKISAQSIRKFIKKNKEAQKALVRKDKETAREVKRITLDYTTTLREILDEVQEVKNEAKTTKDMITFNQMIDKIYKGIELIAKLTGELKPNKTTDITVIYNQIDKDIENEMKHLKNKVERTTKVTDVDYEVEKEDEQVATYIRGDANE